MSCEPKVNACMIMDFVVSTCILHFIAQVKCKNIVKHLLSPHTCTHTSYTQTAKVCEKWGVGGGGGGGTGAASYPHAEERKEVYIVCI